MEEEYKVAVAVKGRGMKVALTVHLAGKGYIQITKCALNSEEMAAQQPQCLNKLLAVKLGG